MITSFLTAVGQTTIIPVGARFRKVAEGREGEVLVFYPLAGVVAGVLPAAILVVCARLLGFQPPLPEALAVAALALVAGLRTLTGLAGTADALAPGAAAPESSPADSLRRIGPWGAAAVALVLLVKLSALAALSRSLTPASEAVSRTVATTAAAGLLVAVLLAAALGRWAAVVLAAYSEYARPEGGPDEWMVRYCGAREMWWSLLAVASMVALVVLAGRLPGSSFPLQWYQAALAGLAGFLTGQLASRHFERRLGGVTGREMLAVTELAETAALAMMCVRFG